jgi:hypothetical protein
MVLGLITVVAILLWLIGHSVIQVIRWATSR